MNFIMVLLKVYSNSLLCFFFSSAASYNGFSDVGGMYDNNKKMFYRHCGSSLLNLDPVEELNSGKAVYLNFLLTVFLGY